MRYILVGSVRKAGGRVRITAQLINATNGVHLWADRFDGSLKDVFELQDKVAISVAGVIEPALQAAETARSVERQTSDLTAYDLYLRAYAMVWSTSAQISEALTLLERAIARDPRYGPALASAAHCYSRRCHDGRSADPAADRMRAIELARQALQVAGDDTGTVANAVISLSSFGEDIGATMALIDRALALNPSCARGWHVSASIRLRAGQLDLAIQHVERSLRLSPRARIGSGYSLMGGAHFLSRRFNEAIPKLLLAIQDDPSYPQPYRWLAACYAHMGRLDEAREINVRLRAITPLVVESENAMRLRNPEHREFYLSGLRLAAGETA